MIFFFIDFNKKTLINLKRGFLEQMKLFIEVKIYFYKQEILKKE
jgi:hypothetical protein